MVAQGTIDQVRDGVNIVELVSGFVALRKAGQNFVGLCPFHAEKTPSFTVSPEKQIFYCFGCQTGGNVFTFLMKIEGLTFYDALVKLADRAGIQLRREERSGTRGLREELFKINEEAASYFSRLLTTGPEGSAARRYLIDRGIAEETSSTFRLGFSGVGWDGLTKHLSAAGASLELAAQVGLVIPRREGDTPKGLAWGGYYDRFRGRLIFPITDARGRVIGFGGRIISAQGEERHQEGTPKYLNSPESAIYKKGESLYGLNQAQAQIRGHNRAVVVEGYFDLISLHQAGIRNVVATLGTALTSKQVEVLRGLGKRITILYDADLAGGKAAQRGLEQFLNSGLITTVALLPPGEDPDSFLRKEGPEKLQNVLDGARQLVDFLIEMATRELDPTDPGEKAVVVQRVLEVLEKIQDKIERDLHIDRLAERLKVRPEHLVATLSQGPSGQGAGAAIYRPVGPANEEELLVRLLLDDRTLALRAQREGVLELISDPGLKGLVQVLILKGEEGASPAGLLDSLEDERLKGLVSRLYLFSGRGPEIERAYEDCVNKMRKREARRRDGELTKAIRAAESAGDHSRALDLAREKVSIKNQAP